MPPDRLDRKPLEQSPYPQQPYDANFQPQPSKTSSPAPSLGRGRVSLLATPSCDGRQPICTPCEAQARKTGEDLSLIECVFDTEEERKKPVGGGKVAGLEAKIVALERRIAELTSQRSTPAPQPILQPFHTLPYAAELSQYFVSPSLPPAASFSHPFATAPPNPAYHPYQQNGASLPPSFSLPPAYPVASTSAAAPAPAPYPAPSTFMVPPLGSSSMPSPAHVYAEPPRLPSPPTLFRLVTTFFDYPHEAVDLMNRRRFMQRFELDPEDPDYPAECLLHAICAVSTDLLGEEAAFEGEERYWPEATSPGLYHADQADHLIPLAFRKEKNLLQVAQAAVLFSATNQAHARFARSFLESSTAVRICIALGLNHISFPYPTEQNLPLSSLLANRARLPPPTDADELQEHAATFWFAVTVEVIAAAATGWACCIDERDITSLLPAAASYSADPVARESLYLHSPAFFSSNPPHLVRLVQINLKSIVLMNRVITFVHRTAALAKATADRGPLTADDFPKVRASPAFQKLEAALDAFARRAPPQLISLLEPQAFITPAFTSASIILLHESFTSGEDGCPSMTKCLEAADVMLQNMFTLNNASFQPRHIPPFLSFCYLVCGRTFIRALALRQKKLRAAMPGIDAATLEADPEVVRYRRNVEAVAERLKAARTSLGPKTAASLSVLLENPEVALPQVPTTGAQQPKPPMSQLMDLMEAELGLTAVDMCG
ncbi:hypothetical protein JCM8097_008294 [Rhodosporidiobolus ruineniae]